MASPLDDIRALARTLPPPDAEAARRTRDRLHGEATSPLLIDLAVWLAAWPGGPDATRRGVRRAIACLYIASSETRPGAPERARATLERLTRGEGAVNALARSLGAGVELFDLGLERPAPDPVDRPAMTVRECAATLAFGMEALAKSPDLLVLSDLTEGSDATAALLTRLLCDSRDAALPDRLQTFEGDALDALRQVGGRETAAIVGALLAARVQGVPVLLDGAAAQAAAAVCDALNPDALSHVRLAAAPEGEHLAGAAPILVGPGGGGEGGLAALGVVKLAGEL